MKEGENKIKKEVSIEVKYSDFTAVYSVLEDRGEELPPYGIKVECTDSEARELKNIFFTFEEAYKRCEWLSENEVFPEGFKDVMADIMI